MCYFSSFKGAVLEISCWRSRPGFTLDVSRACVEREGAIRKDRGKIRLAWLSLGSLDTDQPEPMAPGVSHGTSEGHKRVLSVACRFWFGDWVGEEPR